MGYLYNSRMCVPKPMLSASFIQREGKYCPRKKKAVLDDFFMVSDSGKHAYRVLDFRFCVGCWLNNFRQDDF